MKINAVTALTFAPALCVALTVSGQVTFTQITNGPIATDNGQFLGCAWGDFRNSGFQDVVVCNSAPGSNVYYQNNGDGTFNKVIGGNPVQDINYHVAAVAGDYDNDGHLDLFINNAAFSPAPSHNQLYHNNGDGTFASVSGKVLTNQLGHFGPPSWADYDNDGFLDLFVPFHGLDNSDGDTNLLYHNNGDGSFSHAVTSAIVKDRGVGYGSCWEDYDNDGFMDLLVVNSGSDAHCFLYHNNSDGTFTKVLTNIIATDTWPAGASCPAWADYDNDGRPDLFIADNNGVQNRLYHNEGGGDFTRVTSGPELAPPAGGSSNGAGWGDYDNDGYLDLFVSGNGGQNALFHNNGDGTFTQIKNIPPVQGGGPSVGCGAVSWVDYDNDGFLDLLVGVFSVRNNINAGKLLLYHNGGNSNAWLEVKLIGTASNRSAIGAKIRAHATIGGKTFWQLREINGGGQYNDCPLVGHFGLGEATNVDTLRIEWPSGIVQTLTNVTPRQILTVTEHQAPGPTNAPNFSGVSQLASGAIDLSITGQAGLLYVVESSTNLINWTKIGSVSNATGIVNFTDTKTLNNDNRFYRVSIP